VSHHLKALREAGLIQAEPRGRYTYYRLLPDALDELAGHLTALAARTRATANTPRDCP
jgi:ArsR family transcriptional regulator